MKKRILLVDDDPGVRRMLARLLAEEGYLVVTAADGQEAIQLAADEPVDLALLDLNLPVKNGWQALEELTAQNPLMPVIIITARSNQIFPALASGVDALMEKPLDFPTLLRTLQELLEKPAEARMGRLIGRPTEFHYLPAVAKVRSD